MPTLQLLDQAMTRASTTLPILGRLGGGQIALVDDKRPWRAVGLDNAVYVLRQPSGRVLTLRIPLADGENHALRERYRALGGDPRLGSLREAPGGPLAPRVAWYPDGLLLPAKDLRSTPHPVIVLDWIEGPTLIAAVDRACRAGDGRSLAALADAWRRAIELMASASFVHGDLAGDNVIVRSDGSLTLIDYDAASWPGVPAESALRHNPSYSHPRGGGSPGSSRGDDFAALVVYVSLRALAERPDLRGQFGDPTSEPGGALLWRAWDLTNPDASPVFAALKGASPSLADLIGSMRRACLEPIERTPRLGNLVASLDQSAGGTGGASGPIGAGPIGPANDARAEARGPQAGVRTAAVPATRGVPAARASPPVAAPPVAPPVRHPIDPARVSDAARGKQEMLTRLNAALMAGDPEATLAFWASSGLDRDPETVRDYGPRIRDLERMRGIGLVRAAVAAHDSATTLRLWREYELDMAPRARELQPAVEAARRRMGQAERLRVALDAGDREAVAALWTEVRGDPLVAIHGARVAAMLEAGLGERLTLAIQRGDDRGILETLADVDAASVPIDADARRAGRAAAAREATRKAIVTAQRDGDDATLAELAVSGRLRDLGRLDDATNRAARRAVHRPALTDALAGDDDWAIVAVYDAQAALFDEADLGQDERARIDLAKARMAWLVEVRTALRKRDIATLKLVTRSSPPGAVARLSETERSRIERLSRRDVAVRRLERLLTTGDDREILDALATMKETGAVFPAGFDWGTLRAVEERTELADGIMEALRSTPPDLERLRTLLPAAKAAAQDGNPPVLPGTSLEQVERDVLRAAQISRVRDAIASGDDEAIVAVAMPDPSEILAELTAEERERVRRAVSGASRG